MVSIIKVQPQHEYIIQDILSNHIDESNRKASVTGIDHTAAMLNDNRCYLLAALMDGIVIGYALAYRFPSLYAAENLAYLYDIEVSPQHRRKGVGRMLVESVIGHLKKDNVKELWLGTGVDNPEGQGLFSATGAIKSEEVFNDYTYYL